MNQGTILPTGVRTAALGVAVILFALFSTAARADTVIGNVTLGPNTGTLFQGGGGSGCGGIGATVTLMTSDPLNPGVTVTGNSPCTVALSGGSFGTYIATVTAAPGFRIDDVSFSTACGVSGIGATAGFTLSTPGSTLSGNCPSLPSGQFGLVGPVSTSFAPVNSYTETLTLFGNAPLGGSATLDQLQISFSLTRVPEPASILLVGVGLAGLAMARRRLTV